MQLILPRPIETAEAKQELALKITAHLSPSSLAHFPQQVMAGDNTSWILDSGNDWRLTFSSTNKKEITLTYRYASRIDCREEHFSQFLAKLYSWKVVLPIFTYDIQGKKIQCRRKMYKFDWVTGDQVEQSDYLTQEGFETLQQLYPDIVVNAVHVLPELK